jgi:type III pantothenate kinase
MVARPEPVLCIDIGNSRAKACLFINGNVEVEDRHFTPALAQEWIETYQPVGSMLCAVGEGKEAYLEVLRGPTQCLEAGLHLQLPFQSLYRSDTLGPDRLACVAGSLLHHAPPILAIDAGTCLTYDVLDADGTYQGGAISPGLTMRLRALHQFTAGLPLLSPASEAPLAGLSTEDCMLSGALNGIIFEAEAFQARIAAEHKGLSTTLCGGSGYVFDNRLPAPVQYYPNLVPEGLLLLYWYQKEREPNRNGRI